MGGDSLEGFDSLLASYVPIELVGSVASGKSRFLSLLHAALGYDKVGLALRKERARKMPNNERRWAAVHRRGKGIMRSNATEVPDKMTVYGLSSGNVYGFNFYAPGGHANAVKPERKAGAVLYFIDLGLAHFVTTLGTKWIYRFGDDYRPFHLTDGETAAEAIRKELLDDLDTHYGLTFSRMKKWAGVQSDDIVCIDDLAAALAKTAVNLPNFGLCSESYSTRNHLDCIRYQNELLCVVMQSVIDSDARVKEALRQGVPVVGVCTHRNEGYNTLPRGLESLLSAVENNLNSTIGSFATYQQLNGIAAKPERVELASLGIDWHSVEQVRQVEAENSNGSKPYIRGYMGAMHAINELPPENKMPFLHIAYSIMEKALEAKGIVAEGFRIASFREAKSGLTVPYYSTIPAMLA